MFRLKLLTSLGDQPIVIQSSRPIQYYVLIKHESRLYTLVNDQRYQDDEVIVYKDYSMDNRFMNSMFLPSLMVFTDWTPSDCPPSDWPVPKYVETKPKEMKKRCLIQ